MAIVPGSLLLAGCGGGSLRLSAPLFEVGGVNEESLQTLSNFAARVSHTDGRSNAAQIRGANGGTLPEVRLFQHLQTAMPGVSQTTFMFTGQLWRLVYITHLENQRVMTFMMAGAYRGGRFDSETNRYEDSHVRRTLGDDFSRVRGHFDESINEIIRMPVAMPWTDHMASEARLDPIWLPSEHELGTLWALRDNERIANSWVRNAPADNTITAQRGWAPAIHIVV